MQWENSTNAIWIAAAFKRNGNETNENWASLLFKWANDISRDETANLQLTDEIDKASLRKSNMSEINGRTDTPQIHGQNQIDRCENTRQTIDLQSQKGSEDERRTEDSSQEYSYFIDADIRIPSTK